MHVHTMFMQKAGKWLESYIYMYIQHGLLLKYVHVRIGNNRDQPRL